MNAAQILDLAFRRKFGMPIPPDMDAAQVQKAQSKREEGVEGVPTDQSMPELDEDSPDAKAAATEMLTQAQGIPPVGANDVAVFLNALLAAQRAANGENGEDDALALG